MQRAYTCLAVILVCLMSLRVGVAAGKGDGSLLANGDFAKDSKSVGWPDGWGSKTPGNGVTWEVEGETRFLRLVAQKAGQLQLLESQIKLTPGKVKGVALAVRYRTAGLKAGAKAINGATVLVVFKDGAGKLLSSGDSPLMLADSGEWAEVSEKLLVPEAAARMIVMPGLFRASAGTVDLAKVSVAPLGDDDVLKLADAAKDRKPAAVENVLANGDFAKANAEGDFPAGWGKRAGMTWETEDGKRYVRLVSQEAGQMQTLYTTVPIKAGTRGLDVTIRYRTLKIEPGAHEWFDARTIVHFLGTDGQPMKGEGGGDLVFSHKPQAENWAEIARSYVVPEGAKQLQLMPGLFQCKSGTVDLAEIRVSPMKDSDAELLLVADEVNAIRTEEGVQERERQIDEELAARLKATGNLLEDGGFEKEAKKAGNGKDATNQGLSYGEDNGANYARLTSADPTKIVMVYKIVTLPRNIKGLEVSVKYRVSGLVKGKQMPGDARGIIHLMDGRRYGHMEFGKELAPDPAVIGFSDKAKDWTVATVRFLVPESATKLQFMPGLWFAKSGTLDISEIKIVPMSDADAVAMAAKLAAEAKQKAERAAIIEKELALPATASELKVSGNQILDADGKAVWMQGLSVDSMQWCMGENILWSIHVAMGEWKANVIRLPVHDSFWFGHGKGQKAGTEEAYRKLVDDAVKLVAAKGGHLVLDLHQFGAPTEEHVKFWKDAAARYKNNPAVLFEIFNEPHGISWELWRNGGELKNAKHNDVNPEENTQKVDADKTTGVQAIVDAIRACGAKNIIMAGALDWSYDLTGVVNGFALDDKGGDGIVYVSHIYPWKKDWQDKVLVAAAKYPVIITEIGCPREWKDFSFIPEAQRYPLEGWSEDVLGMIQKNKLHWTGFSFHPHCGPQIILDWDYTPTPYWGVFVKDALAGKQFEMKKMR